MEVSNMSENEVEILVEHLEHKDIVDLRERLKVAGNKNYLLRVLYFDYKQQVWIR